MSRNLRLTPLNGQPVWAASIAGWGDLSWGTKWGPNGGGMAEVSWAMEPNTAAGQEAWRHPALQTGSLVEVMDGPWCLGKAVIDEPDDTEGSYTALGLYRESEKFLALDGSGNATVTPNTAVDQAIARGLRWTRPANLHSGSIVSDTPTNLNRLNALLDEWVDSGSTSLRWFVDHDGAVRSALDPTTPTYFLAPGLTDLGRSDDGYASKLFGRRVASGGGYATDYVADAAAADYFGVYEDPVDLTALGTISSARALQTLDSLMAKGRNRPSFTNSVEVTSNQLITAGGVPADLSTVEAGQMVRSVGMVDDVRLLDGRTYLDWVIGETKYVDGADTISLSPLGLAPTDFESVLESLFPRTRFAA